MMILSLTISSSLMAHRLLSSDDDTPPSWETKGPSIQVSIASVSLIASSAVAALVAKRANGGLSTPFSRIIFGLSISDVLQSLGFLIGPWSLPKSTLTLNSWGIGNDATCQANGFLITLGASAVPMYTCALCLYYLCKLRLKMTDVEFYHRFEKKIHIFIATFNVVVASTALAMDVYHPLPIGTICHFAATPTACRYIPEIVGECDATILFRAELFQIVVSLALPLICFIGIIIFMSMLFWHASKYHNMYREEVPLKVPTPLRNSIPRSTTLKSSCPRSSVLSSPCLDPIVESGPTPAPHSSCLSKANSVVDSDDGGDSHEISNRGGDPDANNNSNEGEDSNNDDRDSRLKVQYLSRLYKNEVLIQSSCYVGAFCLAYLPMLYGYASMLLFFTIPPSLVQLIAFVLYPLGGLFNILVYTRPEVASLRRRHPECSRIRALWLVLKAGGKLPDSFVPSPFWCCRSKKDGERELYREATVTQQAEHGEISQSVRYGVISSQPISGSMMVINGLSQSVSERDTLYTPEDQWSYEKCTACQDPPVTQEV